MSTDSESTDTEETGINLLLDEESEAMKSQLAKDLMKMLENGSNNDVIIKLLDGETKANKDVLMARCDYFATMLGDEKFVEGKSNVIEMKNIKKAIIEKVIKYLYSGAINLDGLENKDKIRLLDLLRLLMLDAPFNWLKKSITLSIPKVDGYTESKQHVDSFQLALETFQLCKDLKIDDLSETLLAYLATFTHEYFPHSYKKNKDVIDKMMESLSFECLNIIIRRVKVGSNCQVIYKRRLRSCTSSAQLALSKAWYQVNETRLTQKEKAEFLNHFLELVPSGCCESDENTDDEEEKDDNDDDDDDDGNSYVSGNSDVSDNDSD